MNGELQMLERPGVSQPGLSRSLSLWHATLYGLGVTIGAGIYVLIGAAAARAGMHAPLAFVAAAGMMAFSAASFAELACRFPVAAGEAAYAREAFGSRRLATVVGLLVVAIAIVSAAAISNGSAGYLAVFLPLPKWVLVVAIVLAMGTVAFWGVKQSVTLAGVMTLIEIGGLLLLLAAGVTSDAPLVARLPEMVPAATTGSCWQGWSARRCSPSLHSLALRGLPMSRKKCAIRNATCPWRFS